MGKINYLIVNLVIIFIFNSCLDIAHDTRNLKIFNNSNSIVYCLMSDSDLFTNPYISYKESGLEKRNILKENTFITYPINPKTWEEYIKSAKNGKLRLFFISKDSLDKNGWKRVLTNNIYTKVYKLDMKEIKKMKWEFIYNGK